MRCSVCGNTHAARRSSRGNEILPRGWHRLGRDAWCGSCWNERWVLRTITIPIAGPVNGEWEDLRSDLRAAWADTTNLSNWLITEYAKQDVTRGADMDKLPPMPNVSLYRAACQRFPEMPTGSICAIEHAVRGKYRSKRYAVIWQAAESLPSYRYPTPFPLRRQDWRLAEHSDGSLCALVTLRRGGKRWLLRLRQGPHFRRQMHALRKVLNGEAITAELSLYRQRANGGDHRSGLELREPGGGQRQHYRIMAKVVLWLQKTSTDAARNGDLIVRTTPGSLLVARLGQADRNGWWLHGDHVRRWIISHRRRLARLSDDCKSEQRRERGRMDAHRGRLCEKHARRISTFLHQASASLVAYAARRGVSRIVYDDSARDYLPHFPYASLRALIRYKADAEAIEMITFEELQKRKQEQKAAAELVRLEMQFKAMLEKGETDGRSSVSDQTG